MAGRPLGVSRTQALKAAGIGLVVAASFPAVAGADVFQMSIENHEITVTVPARSHQAIDAWAVSFSYPDGYDPGGKESLAVEDEGSGERCESEPVQEYESAGES